MTSKLTIEQAKRLRNDFECWQQDYDPKDDKEQYDMFGRGMVAMDMLIAGMYQEPVAYTDERNLGYIDRGRETAYLWGKQNTEASDVALYRHAQLAPASPVCSCPGGDGSLRWPCPVHPGNYPAQSDCCPAQSDCCPAQNSVNPAQGGNSLVIPDEMTSGQAYEIGYYYGDPVDVFARGANWMRQHIIDSTLAAAPQSPGSEPATVPGKWIPVSERMPEDEQEVLTINKMGHRFVSFFDKHSGLFFDRLDAPAACCIEHVLVTHWMQLPAGPREVKGE
ncbi:DUF551 domain-containing protein [Klebsiella pneumoniae]